MGARGFTLIELALATILLAVGLLALLGALAVAVRETESARVKHAALRDVESVADSLSLVRGEGAGAAIRNQATVRWTTVACVIGSCLRVQALTHGARQDTFTVLAAPAPEP